MAAAKIAMDRQTVFGKNGRNNGSEYRAMTWTASIIAAIKSAGNNRKPSGGQRENNIRMARQQSASLCCGDLLGARTHMLHASHRAAPLTPLAPFCCASRAVWQRFAWRRGRRWWRPCAHLKQAQTGSTSQPGVWLQTSALCHGLASGSSTTRVWYAHTTCAPRAARLSPLLARAAARCLLYLLLRTLRARARARLRTSAPLPSH